MMPQIRYGLRLANLVSPLGTSIMEMRRYVNKPHEIFVVLTINQISSRNYDLPMRCGTRQLAWTRSRLLGKWRQPKMTCYLQFRSSTCLLVILRSIFTLMTIKLILTNREQRRHCQLSKLCTLSDATSLGR